jgi:hypothetical protein
VGRPESTRDDAEVGAQPIGERSLELPFVVADDRDLRRREPEPNELAREKRTVAIVPVSPDELASRYDDDATQTVRCRLR